MSRTRRSSKRARFTLHPSKGSHRISGSGQSSLITLTPSLTRRGKVTYREVDATQLYSSEAEEETPKRKIPKPIYHTTSSQSFDNHLGLEEYQLNDESNEKGRSTKVTIILFHMQIIIDN